MADNTHIEWTDATWNPITGCSIVSPGCTNCYAMKLAGTRLAHIPSREGLTRQTKAGPVWTGEVRLNEKWLDQPIRWKRPRKIFVCAHGDLFAEGVPEEWIDSVFAVMALAPHHTFQVLTKRAERMRSYCMELHCGSRGVTRAAEKLLRGSGLSERAAHQRSKAVTEAVFARIPFPHVWLGVSAEDQRRADERIPHLLLTPAAVRFLSVEPLLGPIDLDGWLGDSSCEGCDDGVMSAPNRCTRDDVPRSEQCPDKRAVFVSREHGPFDAEGMPAAVTMERRTVDWVIVGGESGPGARPMHPDWARSLRDQCVTAGVAFHFKQWGAWAPVYDETGQLRSEGNGRPGARWEGDRWVHFAAGAMHGDLFQTNKKAAGRLLDGREWNQFPGANQ